MMKPTRISSLSIILFFLTSISCTHKPKLESQQESLVPVVEEVLAVEELSENGQDTTLLKYRDQKRPEGYDGIMMYDLLKLVNTPDDEIIYTLTKADPNWKKVREAGSLIFQNEKYDQLLTRRDEVVLLFIDYNPNHRHNYTYLKENGYFSYEDADIGNSYFTCDSIFVTWRLNKDSGKGGSSMMLYNIE